MTPDARHQAARAALRRFLKKKYGDAFTAHDRDDLIQEAFVGLEVQRNQGEPIRSEQAVLMTCVNNAAKMRLRAADRRRRHTFDPHDSPETRLPDPTVPPDAAAIQADEDRRVRRLIEQLDARARAVIKLRLDADMSVAEIAGHLGVSRSHADKLLKQAGTTLGESLAQSRAGAHARRERSLLAACVLGIATQRQRDAAARLLEDPAARATLAELRGLGTKAAGALPMPPVAEEISRGRVADYAAPFFEGVKQHATAIAQRFNGQEAASQISASGGFRGAGTSLAIIATCVGVGVGADQCIQRRVLPTAIVDAIPGVAPASTEQPDATTPDVNPPQTKVEPLDYTTPDPVSVVPSPAAEAPADPVQSAPDAREAGEATPAPATASDSLSGLSGDSAAEPVSPPTPAPTPGQSGGSGASSSGSGAAPVTQFGGGL